MMIAGEFGMALFLGGIVVCQYFNWPLPILVCMIGMIVIYQCTLGSYFFVYVSQVGTESQNSVAVFTLWLIVLILSLTTGLMIESIGIIGTFGVFTAATLLGGFYFSCAMKSTEGLSSSDCKQSYWPVEYRQSG